MKKILWVTTIVFSMGIGAYSAMYVQNALAQTNQWVVAESVENTIKTTSDMIKALKPELDPVISDAIAEAVDVECNKLNLPTELVLAVMARESSFRSMSTSSANCVGLMQINPKAHVGLCSPYSRAELYHIEPNIKIGCAILGEYMRSSDSIQKALKRYVGGNHQGYVTDVLATYAELMLKKEL